MLNRFLRQGLTTICLLLSLTLTSTVWAEDKQIMSEAHLKKLREDINELQGYLKKAQDDHKDLVASLRKSDEEVAKVAQQVEKLKSALKEERDRLKKLQAEQRTLNQNKASQQSTLKNIILASYKMGQEPQLKILLNQQDPSKLARNLSYLQYFNKAHQKEIIEYRGTLKKLDTNEQEIKTRQTSLNKKLEERRTLFKKLDKKKKLQQKNALALNQQIKGNAEKLSRLQQDRQNLMALLGKVEEVFLPYERSKESRPFRRLKGKLPNPLQVKPKRLYGKTQNNGKQKWQGWLYPATEGNNVRAIHHGRIVFSDWLRGFGLLTIVDHGQGYMTLYARNQALLRSVGDWVEAGDVIAKLGRSGGFEDSALYFEIRYKGEPQNPRRWLKRG
jgi:septal ring factor EnvC (AmiA/AmiB activator)